jgi:hypothetical protein
MDFGMNFIDENSNKLQKLSLEKIKISWALNVFTLKSMAQVTLIKLDGRNPVIARSNVEYGWSYF